MPPWLTLILMLLALGILGVAITIALIARDILQPPRLTDGIAVYRLNRLSPGDLGLPFEDSPFTVRDAAAHGRPLHIATWWIPAPRRSHRCTVLLHSHGDAKVGAIAWAPLLHQLNHNVLAIDCRAHGESGGSLATAGFFERDDLSQIIDQLRIARPAETESLTLFGLDTGGTTAAAVAAARDDIAAVVIDSPIVDRRRTLAAHARRVGLPAGWVLSAAMRAAAVVSGADFAAIALLRILPQLRCPLLVIVGQKDELIDPADLAALTQAIESMNSHAPAHAVTKLVIVPAAAHLTALQVDPAGYTAAVGSFLAANAVA